MGRAKQYCLFLSVLVIYVFLKREKNLTLKTCAPDFSARSMTKLYAKIKDARAISLFDFPKTWQVWLKLNKLILIFAGFSVSGCVFKKEM